MKQASKLLLLLLLLLLLGNTFFRALRRVYIFPGERGEASSS